MLFCSCNEQIFERTDEGVTIAMNKAKTGGIQSLRLNVISENTIQVLASASGEFSTRKSLSVIEGGREPVDFNVIQNANEIRLSTTSLVVKVNTQKGTIDFFDSDLHSLLKENNRFMEYVDAPMLLWTSITI